jgi:hypothetical protein
MAKLIKSRRNYTCYACKSKIAKGETYSKKSIRIGSSAPDSLINIDGQSTIIAHGITISAQICRDCSIK